MNNLFLLAKEVNVKFKEKIEKKKVKKKKEEKYVKKEK